MLVASHQERAQLAYRTWSIRASMLWPGRGGAVQKLGTFSDLYIPPAEAVAHAIKGDLKTAGEKLRETSLLGPMKAVAEFVETAETGTRLSVFEKVLKQKKKQAYPTMTP
jgi:hypothetical protein